MNRALVTGEVFFAGLLVFKNFIAPTLSEPKKNIATGPVSRGSIDCQPVDINMALASDALDRSPKDGVIDGYMTQPPTGTGLEGATFEGFTGNETGAARRIILGRGGLPVDGQVVGFDRVIETRADGSQVIRFVPQVCAK